MDDDILPSPWRIPQLGGVTGIVPSVTLSGRASGEGLWSGPISVGVPNSELVILDDAIFSAAPVAHPAPGWYVARA